MPGCIYAGDLPRVAAEGRAGPSSRGPRRPWWAPPVLRGQPRRERCSHRPVSSRPVQYLPRVKILYPKHTVYHLVPRPAPSVVGPSSCARPPVGSPPVDCPACPPPTRNSILRILLRSHFDPGEQECDSQPRHVPVTSPPRPEKECDSQYQPAPNPRHKKPHSAQGPNAPSQHAERSGGGGGPRPLPGARAASPHQRGQDVIAVT